MKTVLRAMNAALQAVALMEGTGVPVANGEKIDPELGLAAGVSPKAIAWTEDRGNWTWDGVLETFRVLGVDCAKPISETARFG